MAVAAPKRVPLSDTDIAAFRQSMRGVVLRSGDDGYDAARTVFNRMIDRRPALIARCVGVADVIAAVAFARAHRAVVSVRGGGHNVGGFAMCDGGVAIDLSPMKGVHVDLARRTVRAEAGLTWAELNHELQTFGLASTGGFVGTTGVSGLTLGGGFGWMVRKHGLACDNLVSAEVVTADGRLLTASATENQDLFWALRGGGGNFGIATSFEFRVHPVGTALAGLVMHPSSNGREVLRFWRDFTKTAPRELTSGAILMTAPPAPFVPKEAQGQPVIALGGVCIGPLDAAEATMRPVRAFGSPIADIYQPMPYEAAQSMADSLWPPGNLNYWKSNFIRELSDEALDVILDYQARVPSPMTTIIVEHNGNGALEEVADDETAFGHRRWPYNLLITSIWSNPADQARNVAWTRHLWHAMEPFASEDVYVNYLGPEGANRVRAAYSPAKWERLVALKKKYDPENFFHLNQNIDPNG